MNGVHLHVWNTFKNITEGWANAFDVVTYLFHVVFRQRLVSRVSTDTHFESHFNSFRIEVKST